MEQKFFDLFSGLERAYGRYAADSKKVSAGTKVKGKAATVQGDVNPALWRLHLEGKQGLGIVPVRDDGTVMFAAIDIDVYDLDLLELEKKLRHLKLPMIPCRTKSGGAHLYLFCKEPIPAKIVREHLADWAVALGFPGVEIFPKQDELANKNDVGNWINMPYFGGDDTTRYALRSGKPLTLEQFVKLAERAKITEEVLSSIKVEEVPDMEGAPPCLQILCRNGVPEGTRNEVMFNIGVYVRQRYGEDWEKEFDRYNQMFMHPALDYKEIATTAGSLKKKAYFYSCKRVPLKNFCSKGLCKRAEFGIGAGEGASDPGILIDSITQIRSDPPIWIVGINGLRIQMTTEDIMSQMRFAKCCLNELRYIPRTIKVTKWRELINTLLSKAEVVEAPPDAGAYGQLLHYLETFCTMKAKARNKDEILLDKPWTDHGRVYFRSSAFIRYLSQQRFHEFKNHEIWAALRKMEARHHQTSIKGKPVQTWSVPEYKEQIEDFDIPPIPDQEF